MLDPQLLRRDLEAVKLGIANRGASFDDATYQTLETERRRVIQEAELVKAARNKAAEEVAKLKRAGESADAIITAQREMGDQLKALEQAEREAEIAFRAFVATIPNLPDVSVPVGSDEHANVEIKRWGQLPAIANPMDHVDLGTKLGILDLDRAAKLSGARFSVLMGWGAKLERALAAFMLDRQSSSGYLEVIPPYLVNAESLYGTGQLPKFEEDLFKMPHGESSLYLIPTAEVPVTNLYRDEVLAFDQLPLRHCALTPCFRSEAGSHGRDTKGLIRQHQFHKVELVSFAAPEQAEAELERLTGNAEAILEELELPYRRVLLCTGDMGFSSRKTYDLEVWLPSQNSYREISSCSWFGDFQARRANIKYKPADAKSKATFLHTLNGSGLAVGRTWVAVLENGQQADGSVKIPKALVPFLGTEWLR
ncbi:MAG: serine--tRNA ligase [Holophagaceae bacterium]|nr:serine--tRNA ligase [Holophagaceae bacterium]